MSQVNLSSFTNAAAAAVNQDSAIVKSGDGGLGVSRGPHFGSTHRATMDAFIKAVGEEFGQQGAERARNILRPLYERGMSLEARNVTQIVNIVRDRAAVDFSTEKDNQGRSALDRSVDAMPQARGMSEEHKSELKGYITNAIKSGRCSFNSIYQLAGKVEKGALPGQNTMLQIASNKNHPANKILGAAFAAPAEQARAREYMSRLMSMAAAPEMPKMDFDVEEDMMACALARALPNIMSAAPDLDKLTPERVWQALFNEPLPQGLHGADPDSLAEAFAGKLCKPAHDMAVETAARDPRLNEGRVGESIRTISQAFSLADIQRGREGAGLHLDGPSPLAFSGNRDAERTTDERFDTALNELGGHIASCRAGVSLVVGEDTAPRVWSVDRGGLLTGAGQAEGRSQMDNRYDVIDALATIHGPDTAPPSDIQTRSLISCLGQNGMNFLSRMMSAMGLPYKNDNFTYTARITPGDNGDIKVNLSINNPNDKVNTLRAGISMTVSPDGEVVVGDLHAQALPEETLALNSARAELKDNLHNGLDALGGKSGAELGSGLMDLLKNTFSAVHGSMDAFSDIVNAATVGLGSAASGKIVALLGSPAMGEALALLLESSVMDKKAGADLDTKVPPEIRAAYAQVLEDRRQTLEAVAGTLPCLNILAGALGASLAQPAEGVFWYGASDEAKAIAGAVTPDPAQVQTGRMSTLIQAEETKTLFRGNAGPVVDAFALPRNTLTNAGLLDETRDFFAAQAATLDRVCEENGIGAANRKEACRAAYQQAGQYLTGKYQGDLSPLAGVYLDLFNGLLDKLSTTPSLKGVYTQVVAPMLESARQGLTEARDNMAGGIGREIRASDPNAPDARMCNLISSLGFLRALAPLTTGGSEQQVILTSGFQSMLNAAVLAGGGNEGTVGRLNELIPGFSNLVAPVNSKAD